MKMRFSLVFGSILGEDYYQGAVIDGGIQINVKLCNTAYRFITVFIHEVIHWLLNVFGLPERLHYWNEILSTYFFSYNPPLKFSRSVIRKRWETEYLWLLYP